MKRKIALILTAALLGLAVCLPAAAAGAVCAVGGALLAQQADAETLRKLFGGFLILVGLSEVFLKGLKKK